MKPVYSPQDIENFKISKEQQEYILKNEFTKSQLMDHLRTLKTEYFNNCTPIAYL
jgi:hypothetical protein